MTVKKYRVILKSKSSLKLEKKRGWKIPEFHMLIRDDLQEDTSGGPPNHTGLIYTVEVKAEHVVESIQKAVSHARHITDQISCIHGAAIEYPIPQFSIDIEMAYPDRELAQVFHNIPVLQKPRRTFTPALYDDFFKCLDELRQSNHKSAIRIDRALHYLRSSYVEQEPIDQFEDAWGALEAINPLIRRKYSLSTTYQQKCQKCNKDLFCECGQAAKAPDNASGIDYIITDLLKETQVIARELRGKRLDIVHTRATLSKILNDIVPKILLAQRAVMVGILDIVGIPKEQSVCFLRGTLPLVDAPRVTATAILYDLPVDKLDNQAKYPQLFLQPFELLIPNRLETHKQETRPLAVELNIGMENFSGAWDLLEVHSLLKVDPEDKDPATQITARKVGAQA